MRLWPFLLVGAAIGACAPAAEEDTDASEANLGSCTQATTSSDVNLRAAPVDGAVLVTMPAGTSIEVLGVVDGWAHVRALGRDGWAKASLLSCAEVRPTMTARHVTDAELVVDGAVDPIWATAPETRFDTDWSGKSTAHPTSVRALWSDSALYMLWIVEETGLNVDASRPIGVEREKLYEEDCVEVFLAPNPANRKKYFEIELGPRGHFFDLAIDRDRGTSDVSWSSGAEIKTVTTPEARRAVIEVKLTSAYIRAALVQDAALPMNMFRMEGKGTRQYLAWSPTKTPRPNFHVPEAFGTLVLK